jgi:hypothetical protein
VRFIPGFSPTSLAQLKKYNRKGYRFMVFVSSQDRMVYWCNLATVTKTQLKEHVLATVSNNQSAIFFSRKKLQVMQYSTLARAVFSLKLAEAKAI